MDVSLQLVSELMKICRRAGNAILDVYETDFSVEQKEDSSPLTLADKASHDAITSGLSQLHSRLGDAALIGIPVLSEEGDIPSREERKEWGRYWLIDPLDGTKEFVSRNGEFTVNIALLQSVLAETTVVGDPVSWYPALGMVYAPVTDELFFGWHYDENPQAFRLEGLSRLDSFKIDEDGLEAWWLKKAQRIRSSQNFPSHGQHIRVVASRSHMNEETQSFINRIEDSGRPVELSSSGSSLKLCRVASGEAQVYPRFGPTMEWDTAAADAVCRAAGARVISAEDANPLRYNKENLLNPPFLVTGIRQVEEFLEEQL